MLELTGRGNGDIAEALGMTSSRISIIRGSPMYQAQLEVERGKLKAQILDKQSDKVVFGDPIEEKLKALAARAVDRYESLLDESSSDMVRKSTADSILDRAGYKAHTEKTKVTVEVTEKMADRFERVLGYEPSKDARQTKVTIKEEVSS